MLATVRIGAIHSVVFAGFGASALGERIDASGSRLVFTADVTYRKGKDVALKPIVDEALAAPGHGVEHVDRASSAAGGRARRESGARHDVGRLPRARRRHSGAHTADGGQRAGLHPRDVGHDRQAEAGGSHARRLPGPHRQHGTLVLRPEARATCGGRPRTSAGSSATATWSTRRCIAGCTTVAFEGALDYPHAGRALAHRSSKSSARPASSPRPRPCAC